MAEQSRTSPSDTSLGGVFESDAFSPPKPPAGAHAIEIRDDHGRVIAFSWVMAEHLNEDELHRTAWRWQRERTTRASSLRLLP